MTLPSSDKVPSTTLFASREKESEQQQHAETPQKTEDVEVVPLEPNCESCIGPEGAITRQAGRLWKPFALRWGPISGIVAMLAATGSILASLGILLGSR